MVVVVPGSMGTVVTVVVVVLGSTAMVVTVVVVLGSTGMVVTVVVVLGWTGMVVVGTSGAGGMTSAGAVGGAAGKRSARVVGRQAAWTGATATTDTKVTQAKKSVVTRVLKVLIRLPDQGETGRGALVDNDPNFGDSGRSPKQQRRHRHKAGEAHQVSNGRQE